MPVRPEARGGRGDEDRADDIEHDELHHIDGVDHLRRPEAVLAPLGGEDADPFEERPLVERAGVDRWQVPVVKPIVALLGSPDWL